MPLPAIIAGIARAGAQVFGSAAARAAGSAAASTVGRGVASQAAAPVVRQGGAVLTEAVGNAKQITSRVRQGFQGGAPNLPPAATPYLSPKGWSQTLPSPPPVGSDVADHSGGAASQAARPAPRAGSRGEMQERQPAPNFFEKLGGHILKAKEKYDSIKNLEFLLGKPKGGGNGESLESQYGRLKQGGGLLTGGGGGSRGAFDDQGLQNAAAGSARAEQHDRENSADNRARSEDVGRKATKTAMMGAVAMSNPITLGIAMPLLLARIVRHIEEWGTSLVESRRDLRRFDGAIANAFARLDRQQMMQTARRASDTSGSTTALVNSLGGLRKELAPFLTSGATTVNLLGTLLVHAARFVAFMAKTEPLIAAWLKLTPLIEKALGNKNRADLADYADFIKRTSQGDFKQPQNWRPGPEDF